MFFGQSARALAIEAMTMIKGHQEECNRRNSELSTQLGSMQAEAAKGLGELKGAVASLGDRLQSSRESELKLQISQTRGNSKMWMTLAGGVIMVMLCVVGYLLIHGPPWATLSVPVTGTLTEAVRPR